MGTLAIKCVSRVSTRADEHGLHTTSGQKRTTSPKPYQFAFIRVHSRFKILNPYSDDDSNWLLNA
jgi:hypothetical protein